MNNFKTGTIIYVKKYQECLRFYKDILKLPILFKNNDLTCFDLFGSHLIVEIDDRDSYLRLKENHSKIFSYIRINVEDVKKYSQLLQSKNIAVDYQENSWGTVAKFHDPDGNLIAFRDNKSFEKQIRDYEMKALKDS